MNKFSYIFVIYLLFSTTIPCYVYSNCCEETINSYNIAFESSHPEGECGNCSPMFQCNDCIASFITSSFKVELKLKSISAVSHQPFIKNIPIEPNGIWQPPKIS